VAQPTTVTTPVGSAKTTLVEQLLRVAVKFRWYKAMVEVGMVTETVVAMAPGPGRRCRDAAQRPPNALPTLAQRLACAAYGPKNDTVDPYNLA
jgi:hypothetical protein